MATRRQLLLAGVASAIAPACFAQKPAKIGVLLARQPSFYAPGVIQRLGELGYREGAGATFLQRSADGDVERFPKLARELLDARCDVVFAVGPPHPVRALQALQAAAIVFLAVDYDPIERGIVTELRRPDRNTTGIYIPQGLLGAKRVEIMHEILPAANRYLVFTDPYSRDQLPAVRKAANGAGVALSVVDFDKLPYDFETALASAKRDEVHAFIGLTSPVFATRAGDLGQLLRKHEIPAAGWAAVPAVMRAGFLFGYGDDVAKVSRRAAEIGVRVLKGAKPSDIPVEQADEFSLFINSGVAKMLRVRIPESVRARTTRIEP